MTAQPGSLPFWRTLVLGALIAAGAAGWLFLYDRNRFAYEVIAVFEDAGDSLRTGFMIDGYLLIRRREFRIDPGSSRHVVLYQPFRTTDPTVELFAGARGSDSGPPFQVHQQFRLFGTDLGRHCTILARVKNGRATVGACVPVERGPALFRAGHEMAVQQSD